MSQFNKLHTLHNMRRLTSGHHISVECGSRITWRHTSMSSDLLLSLHLTAAAHTLTHVHTAF